MEGLDSKPGRVSNRQDRLAWIKELVRSEQRMEESGVVEYGPAFDPIQILTTESIAFMNELKTAFIDAASTFNQLKASALGRVKIYGIANTHADFMLFRNGFKLIFSLREPGIVAIRYHFVGAAFQGAGAIASPMATTTAAAVPVHGSSAQNTVPSAHGTGAGAVAGGGEEDLLLARWGAFGDLNWTYLEQPIKVEYLVRYYLTRFVRESAK